LRIVPGHAALWQLLGVVCGAFVYFLFVYFWEFVPGHAGLWQLLGAVSDAVRLFIFIFIFCFWEFVPGHADLWQLLGAVCGTVRFGKDFSERLLLWARDVWSCRVSTCACCSTWMSSFSLV
jgi:hypothetical protein